MRSEPLGSKTTDGGTAAVVSDELGTAVAVSKEQSTAAAV